MYNCVIDVKIVGGNTSVGKVLLDVSAPEDCEFRISFTNDVYSDNPDTAVIFGSTEVYLDNIEKMGKGYAVLITDGKSALPENCTTPSDIWVIPEESTFSEQLIKMYFMRLVNEIKSNFDCRRYKICLETVADSVPDLIWFKNMRGAHLMTNESFCSAVDKTKEQVYKKGHYYIWDIPKEEYDQGDYVCLESEEVVINAGKTCVFDEKVKIKSGMKQFKTYKSPLYDINGEIFGTCGVARDCTDINKIDSELRVILESVPFGIMIEDNSEKLVSANSSMRKYFPDVVNYVGQNCREWKKSIIDRFENTEEKEFSVEVDGSICTLKFSEEAINDVFGEIIGKVLIFQDITIEKKLQIKTLENANTDYLTGLHNRRSLLAYFDKIKNTRQISLITIDLDNFKTINDTCGHKMGDHVLNETADVITNCFKNDFIARLDGDEFIVVITREIEREQLKTEVQGLIGSIIGKFSLRPKLGCITASAGISIGICEENKVHNVEALMYNSDEALYKAKNSGKSTFCFYDEC